MTAIRESRDKNGWPQYIFFKTLLLLQKSFTAMKEKGNAVFKYGNMIVAWHFRLRT